MSEQAKSDDFTEAMWQHMMLVNAECTKKLNQLRAENKALKKEIASFPLTCYWLQEQVTSLELQLASARGIRLDGSMIPAQPFTQSDP